MSDQQQGTITPVDEPGDAELISTVRAGDLDAYGLLFHRHVDAARRLARRLVAPGDVDDLVSEAFAKVLVVLQRGGGPDLAFRAYLLTSVRRLHVDKLRGGARLQTTDDLTPYDPGVPFEDTAVAGFENTTAAKAFASLPERWQQVLWHLEVEGQKPVEVAPMLGMTPNSVSALAYRAREGLRQAFVTLHATDVVDDECSPTRAHLGAYLRGGLSRRDSAKVETHLQDCRPCSAIYLELSEVNADLGAVLAPIILGGAAAGYLAAAHLGAAATKGGVLLFVDRGKDWLLHKPPGRVTGAIAAAAVVVAVAVTAGVSLTGAPDRPTASPSTPPPTHAASPGPGPATGPTTGPATGSATGPTPAVDGPPAPARNKPRVTPLSSATLSAAVAPVSHSATQEQPATNPSAPADGAPIVVTPLAAVSVAPEARSVVIDLTRGVQPAAGGPLRVQSARIRSKPRHGTVQIDRAPARTTAATSTRTSAGSRARALFGAAPGTADRRRSGTITYTPDLSWRGTEVISYVLSDGENTVGGTVRVRTPNRRPIAVADTKAVHVGASGRSVQIAVLDNDADPNHDPLTVISVTAVVGPLGGRATVAPDGRHVVYRPRSTSMRQGKASFRYTVSDGHGATSAATVAVTYGNAAPTAVDDHATTPRTDDRSVVVDVLGNDSDPDGDLLEAAVGQGPAHGTVVAEGNRFRYTPDAAFDGNDSFSYTASDVYGGTSTATVTITVLVPHSDLLLTSEHPLDPGEGAVGFHYTAAGIPPARHARFTATITGFGEWTIHEPQDGGPVCSESLAGTTMTVVCTVTGDPQQSEFPFLHADFRPVDAWTVDATLDPVDFDGASGTLHREGQTVPRV